MVSKRTKGATDLGTSPQGATGSGVMPRAVVAAKPTAAATNGALSTVSDLGSAPLVVRHDLADPSSPAGMVRISDGRGYRFIWPVHLSGWESMGWQVVGGAGSPGPVVVEPLGTAQVTAQVEAPKAAASKASKPVASEPVDSEPLVLEPGAEGGSELADDLLI